MEFVNRGAMGGQFLHIRFLPWSSADCVGCPRQPRCKQGAPMMHVSRAVVRASPVSSLAVDDRRPRRDANDVMRQLASLLALALIAATAPAQAVRFGIPNPG